MVLENWAATCTRLKLDYFITPHMQNRLKMDERPKSEIGIYQNPRGDTGRNLFGLSHSNFWLDMFPKARETKAKMKYWDFIKIKSFCAAKETVNKTKRQPTEWEKICLLYTSDAADDVSWV